MFDLPNHLVFSNVSWGFYLCMKCKTKEQICSRVHEDISLRGHCHSRSSASIGATLEVTPPRTTKASLKPKLETNQSIFSFSSWVLYPDSSEKKKCIDGWVHWKLRGTIHSNQLWMVFGTARLRFHWCNIKISPHQGLWLQQESHLQAEHPRNIRKTVWTIQICPQHKDQVLTKSVILCYRWSDSKRVLAFVL